MKFDTVRKTEKKGKYEHSNLIEMTIRWPKI